MTRRHRVTSFLVAALTALLTGSFVGAAGLVLCLGVDGHRALEFAHPGMECPATFASAEEAGATSLQPSAECVDRATAGMGPVTLSPADADQVPTPPLILLPAALEPAPETEAHLPASIGARASPPRLAHQLRSTVLLV